MMTTEKKAEKALLMAGYSGSLFRCIATSGKPADAITRLSRALTETPAPAPKPGGKPGRSAVSIDEDAVKAVVADYYADNKATDETSDAIETEPTADASDE